MVHLSRLAQAGLTSFDCADIYTGVERLLGRFYKDYKQTYGAAEAEKIRFHTKFVPNRDNLAALTRVEVTRIIDRSLQRLGSDRLDLVQFHWWDYAVPGYMETALWLEELRQSLRILKQAAKEIPPGRWMSDDYRYCYPQRQDGLHDIESLIHHFVNVSSGPAAPVGECYRATESSKGECGYYLVSDGGRSAYRCRIRTPSFAHMQAMAWINQGVLISDLIANIGSIDFILADLDR